MARPLLLAAVLVLLAPTLGAQIDKGDEHWLLRSEGHDGATAQAAQIDAAIAAYQKAIQMDESNLEARWKLVRALRFKGSYAVQGNDAKRDVFAQARAVSEKAVTVVTRSLTRKGVKSFEAAGDEQIAKAAAGIRGAAETFYWDAVAWGEWAIVYGKLAAVRQGAAERIRKSATVSMLMDPSLDGGGGARVLGRLHNQTPRVPFLTGWASDKLAVRYLREALSRDPSNKLTKVFLAEAMVANDSSSKPQAIELLREVINSPNDLEMIVENFSAQEDAIVLLERWQ